jgi:hypothetical protein
MNQFIKELNIELDSQLKTIDRETDKIIEKSKKSFDCVSYFLKRLKKFVLGYTFCDEQEEILFFKKQKPEIYSKSIYFKKVAEIESRRPIGCHEEIESYIKFELKRLTGFFNEHKDFYEYYRTDSTHLDDIYFLRGKNDLKQKMKGADMDENFTTGYDYTVAKIIAFTRLEVYLKKELKIMESNSKSPHVEDLGILDKFRWTGSKISLIELIYALSNSGVLNDGNCKINELTELFEQMFHFPIDDIYRGFQDIRGRIKNKTVFLDILKDALNRKINEDCE